MDPNFINKIENLFKDKQFERIEFEIDLLDDAQKKNPFFYNILGIIEATKKNYIEAKNFFYRNNYDIETKIFKNIEHRIPTEGSSLGLEFLKKNLY